MNKMLVRKTKYGYFEYKFESEQGFRAIPSSVDSKEKIISWYCSGGHVNRPGQYNEPEVVFCNQQGTPAVHYSIKSGETFAGSKFAIVNNDPTKKFLFNDITTDAEKLEFLRFYLPEDAEAEAFENDKDKIKSYLQITPTELKATFKQMIAEKLTPEIMREQCITNAKTYGDLPAEVEFNND